MRIILFHPMGYDNVAAQVPIARFANHMAPIGILTVAAYLRDRGHDVAVLDAGMEWKVHNVAWARRIAERRADYVGFSVTTSAFHDAYDVARRIKSLDSGIRIVFGGVHASWGKGALLEKYPAIDYIVVGEGEQALSSLAAGDRPGSIQGVFYRDGAAVKSGPERTDLLDLDDLPLPAFDLLRNFPRGFPLPLFSYPRFPGASIISSRGCVYECSYCDRSVFRKTFRWNSPEYTVEQMRMMRADFGIRHFNFYDDLFTLNRNRVARLCSLLRKQERKVSFNCIVRVNHIDSDLIAELRSAGCWMVNVGIESGDQGILDSHKEGLRLEKIAEDVQALHMSGLWVKGLFMMGFPGETEQSMHKTREFAKTLPLKDANLTAFTPFPGSRVHKNIREYGELDDDWSRMDCLQFVFLPHGIADRSVLTDNYGRFIREFYNRPFMKRVWPRMLWQSPHSFLRLIRNAPRFILHARRNYGAGRKPRWKGQATSRPSGRFWRTRETERRVLQ